MLIYILYIEKGYVYNICNFDWIRELFFLNLIWFFYLLMIGMFILLMKIVIFLFLGGLYVLFIFLLI